MEAEIFHDKHITPIVENRYQLIHALGMAQGAEIILEFSKGERYFNRMHTAALDGHMAEASHSFPLAFDAFETAVAKL